MGKSRCHVDRWLAPCRGVVVAGESGVSGCSICGIAPPVVR